MKAKNLIFAGLIVICSFAAYYLYGRLNELFEEVWKNYPDY